MSGTGETPRNGCGYREVAVNGCMQIAIDSIDAV